MGRDVSPPYVSHPFRTCEFCGCVTNAHLRACCEEGRKKDLGKCFMNMAEVIEEDRTTQSLSKTELEQVKYLRREEEKQRLQEGSPCDHHSWSPWRSAHSQFGENSPADNGVIYRYMRECEIAGCAAIEYAEDLAVQGKRIIDHTANLRPSNRRIPRTGGEG